MQIGKLDKRIRLQNRSSTLDDYGQPVNTWSNLATVWANIKPLTGREKAQMQMVDSILTHRVTIRYRVDFMPPTTVDAYRIAYETPSGTRIFNITAAQDVDEARQHIQFDCQEGSQTGAS
jgi:SPP1 family predicted phage head-tail adaptor